MIELKLVDLIIMVHSNDALLKMNKYDLAKGEILFEAKNVMLNLKLRYAIESDRRNNYDRGQLVPLFEIEPEEEGNENQMKFPNPFISMPQESLSI